MLEREWTREAGADFVLLLLEGSEDDKFARFEVLEERPLEDEAESRDFPE